MTSIKAVVRNGRIEIDKPINLPDGTQLTISIPDPSECPESISDDGSDTSEAIGELASLVMTRWNPLEFTTKSVPNGRRRGKNRRHSRSNSGKNAPGALKAGFHEALFIRYKHGGRSY